MDRLTYRSEINGVSLPKCDNICDFCKKGGYVYCKDCHVEQIIDRLCKYEDTGLSPEEIVELKDKKNTAIVRRCLKKSIKKYGVPKEVYIDVPSRVTRNGIDVLGKSYYSAPMVFAFMGEMVDAKVNRGTNCIEVYHQGHLIEKFDLINNAVVLF